MKSLLLAGFTIMGSVTWAADDLPAWLNAERGIAINKLEQNISPADGAPGSVVASPQREGPDYYYNWTRDAAATMNTVVSLFANASGKERNHFHDQLLQYAQFSRTTQRLAGNLGEPKFFVDGRPYTAAWCRPQSDGPALRVIALTRFAFLLLAQGESQAVARLYDGKLPTDSVIKADLEYVSHHWQERTCDLWEEVEGDHFYTRMVQRRALLDGADLADKLGDVAAATWYRAQASGVEASLGAFWNGNLVTPTLNRTAGLNSKASGVDSSVILATIHADRGDGFFAALDPRVRSTFAKQVDVFRQKYAINGKAEMPGIAIGRYPEDIYDGGAFKGGNPWVLLTCAFGRYSYKAALELLNQGRRVEAMDLLATGDSFMRRVRFHANPDGSLSEQMDRDSGYMTSARDLTWSYVELIEAVAMRDQLVSKIAH